MAIAANITAAFLSFLSLTLVAISMATNYWIRFTYPRTSPEAPLKNPFVTNTELTNLRLEYDVDYFGLWVGCHREQSFNKISCGFIGTSCYSTICWTRNRKEKTCQDSRIIPLANCSAYRATRALMILGTLFLIIGAAIFLVSTCVTSQNLTSCGTLITALAGLFLLIAFVVFYVVVFTQSGLNEIANIAWSFVLLIVAWPIAILSVLIGVIAACSTKSKPQLLDDDFDD